MNVKLRLITSDDTVAKQDTKWLRDVLLDTRRFCQLNGLCDTEAEIRMAEETLDGGPTNQARC